MPKTVKCAICGNDALEDAYEGCCGFIPPLHKGMDLDGPIMVKCEECGAWQGDAGYGVGCESCGSPVKTHQSYLDRIGE